MKRNLGNWPNNEAKKGLCVYHYSLKDTRKSNRLLSRALTNRCCKRWFFLLQVYFLWICPTHRQFEWFIDVLRDVERKDVTNVLEMHIFITQFFHKFDLRTTMLVSIYGSRYSGWMHVNCVAMSWVLYCVSVFSNRQCSLICTWIYD